MAILLAPRRCARSGASLASDCQAARSPAATAGTSLPSRFRAGALSRRRSLRRTCATSCFGPHRCWPAWRFPLVRSRSVPAWRRRIPMRTPLPPLTPTSSKASSCFEARTARCTPPRRPEETGWLETSGTFAGTLSGARQGDGERRAGTRSARDRYGAVVLGGHPLNEAQPEPGALDPARPRRIRAKEPLEDTDRILFRETDSGVLDNDDCPLVLRG